MAVVLDVAVQFGGIHQHQNQFVISDFSLSEMSLREQETDEAAFLDLRALSVSAPPQAGDGSFLFLLSLISTRALSQMVLWWSQTVW